MNAIRLSKKIREATHCEHQKAENLFLLKKIINKTISQAEYINFLKKLYGFWSVLEQEFLKFNFSTFYFQEHAKLPLLRKDLSFFGISGGEILNLPLCNNGIILIEDMASFLGCLYVMEGSMMGGQIISRLLKEILSIELNTGGAYFFGYGSKTHLVWVTLCERIDTLSTFSQEQKAIQTAIKTFQSYRQWINQT